MVTRKYTLKKQKVDERDFKFSYDRTASLPSSVDLRSIQSNCIDQGHIGSCVGCACVGALECLEIKDKDKFVQLSPLFVYWNARQMENDTSQDAGCEIRDAVKSISKLGCCTGKLWPYNVYMYARKPSVQSYTDGANHKIVQYLSLNGIQDYKAAIASGFPVIIGIQVYESFEWDATISSGIVPMPGPNEKCLGGHGTLLISFSDDTQTFGFKNSWGSDFGKKGFGTLTYSYIGDPNMASDAWVIQKEIGY